MFNLHLCLWLFFFVFCFVFLKYLSQACTLLNVLLWCQFSSCLPLLLTSFSIPGPEESSIEVEPISPYTVFTQTRSLLFFYFIKIFFPLVASWLELFFNTQKHVLAHTHTYPMSLQFTHHTVISLRDTISCWKANYLSWSWHIHVLFGHTCRGAALLYSRPPISVQRMSPPPVACVLMNVLSSNSSLKTVIPDMPCSCSHALSFMPSPSFTRPLMLSFLSPLVRQGLKLECISNSQARDFINVTEAVTMKRSLLLCC